MISNQRYEILTPMGFKNFEGMSKSYKKLLKISTDNFSTKVSENHPFEVMGEIVNSSKLKIGDLIDTENGLEPITEIKKINPDTVYDIHNVENCNNYYGDHILQHNCFFGSSHALLDLNNLQKIKSNLDLKKINYTDYPIGPYNVKIFKNPNPEKCYIVGCDVGDGVGADESVISVYDITNPIEKIEQVASFNNNKISRTEVSYLLAKIGNLYNYAPILVESNNMGSGVLDFLFMIYEYENLASIDVKRGFGILSNNNSKINACLHFKKYMDHPKLNCILYEELLYTQLEWFIRKERGNTFTFEADKNKNDDHVLATIWAFYLLKPQNLEYFFEFNTVDLGLEQIPTNLQPIYNFDNKEIQDKFYDETFRNLQEQESIANIKENMNLSSINSEDNVDGTNQLNNGSSQSGIKNEDDFMKNLGFFPF